MRILSVFVFVALLAGVLYTLLTFTNLKTNEESYLLTAYFSHTGGIEKGAPIQMVGKTIGEVEDVILDSQSRGIKMMLGIRSDIEIPDDSELKIVEKGMLGEMYLSFSYGDSEVNYKPLADINGAPPVNLTDFMGSAGNTVENVGSEVTKLVSSLNNVIGDEEVQTQLKTTLKGLPDIISSAQDVLDLEKDIKVILGHLNGVLKESQSSVQSVNQILVDFENQKLFDKLSAVLNQHDELAKRLNLLSSEISPLLNEGQSTLKSLSTIAAQVKPVFLQMEKLLVALNMNKGTGGKLINEDALYDNMNELLQSGTALLKLLEDNPSSIIFGKRKNKKTASSRRPTNEKEVNNVILKYEQ